MATTEPKYTESTAPVGADGGGATNGTNDENLQGSVGAMETDGDFTASHKIPARGRDQASTTGADVQVSRIIDALDFFKLDRAFGRFPNVIQNPEFMITQHGLNFISPVHGAYTLDGWIWLEVGSSVVTINKISNVPTEGNSDDFYSNSLQIAVDTSDVTLGAGDYTALLTYVEGFKFRHMRNKVCTLQFWANSTKTGIHCVSIRNDGGGTPDRSYVIEYTIASTNTWEFFELTFTMHDGLSGTWDEENGRGLRISWCLGSGSTFGGATANTWESANYLATSNQVNVMDNPANRFFITGVQLKVGPKASVFQHRTYEEELQLAQRYYYRVEETPANVNVQVACGVAINTTTTRHSWFFPVTMRAKPVIVDSQAADFSIVTSGGDKVLTGLAFAEQSIYSAELIGTASSLGAGDGANLEIEVASDGWIEASAEL